MKVPISIVAVNRIDHTDWLDIMMDELNHLSPHVLVFLRNPILYFPMYGNEQMVIITLHLKSIVEKVLNLHFDEIELVVVLKSLHVGKYFNKILGNMLPPQ